MFRSASEACLPLCGLAWTHVQSLNSPVPRRFLHCFFCLLALGGCFLGILIAVPGFCWGNLVHEHKVRRESKLITCAGSGCCSLQNTKMCLQLPHVLCLLFSLHMCASACARPRGVCFHVRLWRLLSPSWISERLQLVSLYCKSARIL